MHLPAFGQLLCRSAKFWFLPCRHSGRPLLSVFKHRKNAAASLRPSHPPPMVSTRELDHDRRLGSTLASAPLIKLDALLAAPSRPHLSSSWMYSVFISCSNNKTIRI